MTELIVALDFDDALEALGMMWGLRAAGVAWFKAGPRLLLCAGGVDACLKISDSANLMLDMKLYDTRDTVAATARRAFELGARFLTVHATPSMLRAAMAVKTDARQKVLGVGMLTDGNGDADDYAEINQADGRVCSVVRARLLRQHKTILVCPGIRPVDRTGNYMPKHNHINVGSPTEARAAGADYVVVGRPIIQAADPAAAARTIMEELR